MTEQEIIQANVAKWRKEQEARKNKTKKQAKKKQVRKQAKNAQRERAIVRKSGVAFDALKEALEDAIDTAKEDGGK